MVFPTDAMTIGTCSLCGGPVKVPGIWHGIIPPTPTCGTCGATAKENHGPVVEMKPRTGTVTTTRIVTRTDTSNNPPDGSNG